MDALHLEDQDQEVEEFELVMSEDDSPARLTADALRRLNASWGSVPPVVGLHRPLLDRVCAQARAQAWSSTNALRSARTPHAIEPDDGMRRLVRSPRLLLPDDGMFRQRSRSSVLHDDSTDDGTRRSHRLMLPDDRWSNGFVQKWHAEDFTCAQMVSRACGKTWSTLDLGTTSQMVARSVFMLLLVVVPQLLLFTAARGSELADRHFRYNTTVGEAIWEPVEQCPLAPPMPFWMKLFTHMAKGTGLLVLLGGPPRKADLQDFAPRMQLSIFWVANLYQVAMIPMTMLATIHFFIKLPPFQSSWAWYECFGMLWTLGPWWFNIQMFVLAFHLSEVAASGSIPASIDCVKAVAGEPTLQRLEFAQAQVFNLVGYGTCCPYLLVWSPYIVTHLIPGLIIFSPLVVVIIVVMNLWHVCLLPVAGEYNVKVLFCKTRGLHLMPLLVLLSIMCEASITSMVYFRASDGTWDDYFDSMKVVWLERRAGVYISNFSPMVMGNFYAAVGFLHQVT